MIGDLYVVLKRGLYYRPNAHGYTGLLSEAGRFDEATARAGCINDAAVSCMRESEADQMAPGCSDEQKVRHYRARLATAQARIADLERNNAELVAERDNIAASIGTTRFMDPPDGGGVTLAEQVRRMRAELIDALRPFGAPILPWHSEPDHWPVFGKKSGEGWPTNRDVRRASRLVAEGS